MAKLVFNIERINASTLRAQQRHDKREGGDLTHTNPRLQVANQALIGTGNAYDDTMALMDKKGVKVRADNKAPFTRIVLSASPEMFEDVERSKKWIHDSLSFVRKKWGDSVPYAYLHMDEKTPHLHIIVVPIIETKRGPLSSHHKHPATTGPNSFERLRRECAEHLQLDYGQPGNKPKTQAKAIIDEARAKASAIISQASTTALSMFNIAHEERRALEQERAKLKQEREAHDAKANALFSESLRLKDYAAAARIETLKSKPTPTPARTRTRSQFER